MKPKILKDKVLHACSSFFVKDGILYYKTYSTFFVTNEDIPDGPVFALLCECEEDYDSRLFFTSDRIIETDDDVNCMACLAAECT